jgi:hypothetical protein
MSIFIPGGYALPGGAFPLTHARIIHARNWLAGGSVTASTTATDFFAAGPTNSLTYERWKPTGATATWEYNHGAPATVDSCGIAAHTLATAGGTVAVEYWNGSAWIEVARGVIPDNGPIMFLFAPVTAQRWRLSITGSTAPEIGVIRFARAMQMERPFFGGHTPIDFGRQVVLRSNYTETGEYVGRSRQSVMLTTSCAWSNLSQAWINANWPAFQRAVEVEAFFIAWRPGDSQMVAYAQTDAVPAPQTMGVRDLYSVELNFRAYSHD